MKNVKKRNLQKMFGPKEKDNLFGKSTRYDDCILFGCIDARKVLHELRLHLEVEISEASCDVYKLERLKERYWSDLDAAKADNNMAYIAAYDNAISWINNLIKAYMSLLPNIVVENAEVITDQYE